MTWTRFLGGSAGLGAGLGLIVAAHSIDPGFSGIAGGLFAGGLIGAIVGFSLLGWPMDRHRSCD